MTATGHAVIGTVIAASIANPVVAIPVAVLSHIAADAFPHWDLGTNRAKKSENKFVSGAVIDLIASYAITLLLVIFIFPKTNLVYAYINVFAAQFFDWASAPYVFLKIKTPPIFFYFYKFQKLFDNRLDKPWGVIGQVAILFALVFIVWKTF